MTTNASRGHYQGLLIPDDRVTVWAEESINLERTAGAHVAQPVEDAGQRSDMVLRTLRRVRTEGVSVDDVTITTQAAGIPQAAAAVETGTATFTWEDSTGTFGHSPFHVITGYRALKTCDGTGIDLRARFPSVCVTRANTALVAYGVALSASQQIHVRRMAQGAADWEAPVKRTGLDKDQHPHPCLVPLESGRVLLYYWKVGTGAYSSERLTIAALYSDDDGVTWQTYADSVLQGSVATATHEGQHLSAAAAPDGRVMLLAQVDIPGHTEAKVNVWQYGSLDHGVSFREVYGETDDALDDVACPSVVFRDGLWIVASLRSSYATPLVNQVASPFSYFPRGALTVIPSGDLWDTTTWSSSKRINALGLTLTADETGTLYLYGIDRSVSVRTGRYYVSRDLGVTWTTPDEDLDGSTWFVCNETETSPTNPAAAVHEGRVLLVHDRDATGTVGTNHEGSIAVMFLGGYETVTAPRSGAAGWASQRVNYTAPWFPYHLPTDDAWAATGSVDVEELDAYGGLHLEQTSGTATRAYYRTPIADEGYGFVAMATADTRGGGAANKDQTCRFDARFSNGTSKTYGIRVTQTATDIYLFSDGGVSHTQVATASITPPTWVSGAVVPIEYKWVVTNAGKANVWWRYGTGAAANAWTLLGSIASLTNIFATATTSRVLFGANLDAGMEAWVYGAHYDPTGDDRAQDLAEQTAATMAGRAFSTLRTYVTTGIVLQSRGGPTVPGESWTIATAYDHDAEQLLTPSPRRGWRTIDDAQDVSIALRLGEVGSEIAPTDVIGIGLARTNVPRIEVELYDGDTSTWSAPVVVDLTYGELRWLRHGAGFSPATSGSYAGKAQPHVREGEWDGAQLAMGTKTRIIHRTKGGKWTSGTTSRPVLYASAMDGSEAASGSSGRMIAPNVVVLMSLRGTRFSGVRITIPAAGGDQKTSAEGYWRIGALSLGSVYVFADELADGRVVGTDAHREVIAYDDGAVESRVLGPPSRFVEVSLMDGVDTRLASEDDDDPAYHKLDASGQALALSGATPWDVEGLFNRLQRLPSDHLWYLPRVESFSDETPQVLNRRHNVVYGRMNADTLRLETALGDEGVDEVVRVAMFTLGERT